MEKDKLLKAALEWAAQGVPVFPCGPDKTPLTENGHKDASLDPDTIKFMFSGLSENTLIGAQMGRISGLFACDFDLYKPGAEDYMRSLIDRGLLNETQTHITRSGGLHFLYRGDTQPNCKPAFGVEVKGEGGYVIVPPSPGYSIERKGINTASPALIEELLHAQKASSSSSVDKLKRDVLSGKAFHDPLAQIAARRSAQGWSIEKVQQELIDVLKASAASSPSHPRHDRWRALIEDRGEELSRIVGTGNDKYNSKAKTEKTVEKTDGLLSGLASGSSSFFGARPWMEGDEAQPTTEDAVDTETDLDWPFKSVGYEANAKKDILQQRYIVYPIFAERETVLLAAEPKAGKTAVMLALSAAVAQGVSMDETLAVSEAVPVLYFTLEGARAVELRLEAMRAEATANNLPAPDLSKLFIVDRPHNFLETTQQEANCAKIALHSAKCEQVWGKSLGMIVIDTVTKAMPGGDQNSVEDTSKLFDMIGKLRTFGVTATIVFIHHLSKQGNVRGSTNIEAEVDVVLGLEKIKNSTDVYMNIRRARSVDEDMGYRFGFKSVDLGTTAQGHKLSAPVITLVGTEAPTSGDKVKMSATWMRVCEALVTLGAGQHDVSEMVLVLEEWVPQPETRRPKYTAQTIQKPLKALFAGKFSWAFGDWHMSINRDADENIIGVDLRFTASDR